MSEDWQRLSIRQGQRAPSGPFEGVPDHLRYPLRRWLEDQFGFRSNRGMNMSRMLSASMRLGIPIDRQHDIMEQIFAATLEGEESTLDLVDAVVNQAHEVSADHLREMLRDAGSVWTVSPDGNRLERRVDAFAAESYEAAACPDDEAAAELRQAWTSTYGLHPNPSDAWDHSIKALEAVLIPIVIPSKSKPTLGDVVSTLQSSEFAFDLETSHRDLRPKATLEALLRFIWPNPDRHAGSGGKRTPSVSEAEAVLQLTVAIVQWVRVGVIRSQ